MALRRGERVAKSENWSRCDSLRFLDESRLLNSGLEVVEFVLLGFNVFFHDCVKRSAWLGSLILIELIQKGITSNLNFSTSNRLSI